MKYINRFLATALLSCAMTLPAAAQQTERYFPTPSTVSPEMQKLIEAKPLPHWNSHPKNTQEWKQWSKNFNAAMAKPLPALREQMLVSVASGKIGGVPVLTFSPKGLEQNKQNLVLLNLHGGGYVLGQGESGTQEAILMAAIGRFKVIYVDYRLALDFPYPAAIDDAMSVYAELLKTTPANRIGVFGTSTGGGMALILALRAKAEGLPLPGAIAAGTPWTDLTKTGDSYFTNAGVDNILVSYEGWLQDAARVYANGHELKDPMLSPVYGDVSGFPPTLLTSGTRDLFLSNTVRMHLKLREAGVLADLIVFEGMSHAQYHMAPNAPETKFHFSELARFFSAHLN